RVSDRPTAATAEPRKLEMPPPRAASAAVAMTPRIPALVPTSEETAEPIGVRRTGQSAPGGGNAKTSSPEDAPVLLVSTRPGAVGTPTGAPNKRMDQAARDTDAGQEPDPSDPIATTTRNLQGYQR